MIKKKRFIFILSVISALTISISSVYAQDREIIFAHENFNEILAKAKKENKLIFMDCWATWCRPCIQMANTAFKDNAAADFYNSTFVNAKFDMEKGEGIELKERFQVSVFPTLLFINGNGKIVHRSAGSRDAAGLMDLGKTALNPNERLGYFEENYEANKTDGTFVLNYLNGLKHAYAPYNKVIKSYFSELKEQDYVKQENWNLIVNFVEDYNLPVFKYLAKNKKVFAEKYGEKVVENKIEQVYFMAQAQFLRRNFDQAAYDKNKELILAEGGDLAKRAIQTTDVYAFQIQQDWGNFVAAGNELILKMNYSDASRINSMAWTAFQQISDNELLKSVINWMEKAVEIDENAAYFDTLANLYFKTGNKDKAIENQEKAIKLAENSGDDVSEYLETLKKFKE
jgi:thiol-disulfide isomerase/thioredoxin